MTYGWSKGETVKNVGGFMTNLIDTIVYAGRLKNKSNLMNSSSGGAFTALSDYFMESGNPMLWGVGESGRQRMVNRF